MSPVDQAVAAGEPIPATDEELKALYSTALSQIPPEQQGFLDGLLPADADRAGASCRRVAWSSRSRSVSSTTRTSSTWWSKRPTRWWRSRLPSGYTVEPFSTELIFSGTDEFQAEIGRLFASVGFIILLVLTTVFLVLPKKRKNKIIAGVGIAAMFGAIVMLVLPGLAKGFPDLFPAGIGDWQTSTLLIGALSVFALVFAVWSFSTGRLRRTIADTLVTMAAIGFAISIMNGFGYLIYGEAGPMSQILPILLIGLGVDYSIHITSRYREDASRRVSRSPTRSRSSIRTVGIALVLATITTSVGFLTNLLNDIPALREFGVLAAIGIVASFLIMLTFVPAVRLLLDSRGERRGTLDRDALKGGDARFLPRMIGRTSWLAKYAAIPTIVVALMLGVLGAIGTSRLEASFSFIDFVPVTSPYRVDVRDADRGLRRWLR